MEIIRVINDKYSDLFNFDSLLKRNCFVVLEGDKVYYYEFFVNDMEAKIKYNDDLFIYEVITEYRFYNEYVSKFYDLDNKMIKDYPIKQTLEVLINLLQPSQFFINKKKLEDINSWIEDEVITIPVINKDSTMIILDGHTRLYALKSLGYETVRIYILQGDVDGIDDFVYLAKEQSIMKISDLKEVSEADYAILWHQFCDEYFKMKKEQKA